MESSDPTTVNVTAGYMALKPNPHAPPNHPRKTPKHEKVNQLAGALHILQGLCFLIRKWLHSVDFALSFMELSEPPMDGTKEFNHSHVKNLNYLKCLLLIVAATWLSGCTRLQQYSIESYQGPFPIHDRQHIYELQD
jgi:hypothetical protein